MYDPLPAVAGRVFCVENECHNSDIFKDDFVYRKDIFQYSIENLRKIGEFSDEIWIF